MSDKKPFKRISVTELRDDMNGILHRILVGHERYVISKHGQDYAILVPIDFEIFKETYDPSIDPTNPDREGKGV